MKSFAKYYILDLSKDFHATRSLCMSCSQEEFAMFDQSVRSSLSRGCRSVFASMWVVGAPSGCEKVKKSLAPSDRYLMPFCLHPLQKCALFTQSLCIIKNLSRKLMLLTRTEQINITLEKSKPLSLLCITILISKELRLEMWNAGSEWPGVKYK